MYRISTNVRKYSPTPIVKVTVGEDGKEQEEIVLCAVNVKKAKGDQMSERIVALLNAHIDSF